MQLACPVRSADSLLGGGASCELRPTCAGSCGQRGGRFPSHAQVSVVPPPRTHLPCRASPSAPAPQTHGRCFLASAATRRTLCPVVCNLPSHHLRRLGAHFRGEFFVPSWLKHVRLLSVVVLLAAGWPPLRAAAPCCCAKQSSVGQSSARPTSGSASIRRGCLQAVTKQRRRYPLTGVKGSSSKNDDANHPA